MNSISLKNGKDKSIFRYHPWIFSGAIDRIEGKIQEGDLVKVYNAEKKISSHRALSDRLYRYPYPQL